MPTKMGRTTEVDYNYRIARDIRHTNLFREENNSKPNTS